jgi:hypothetical protein
VNGLRLKKQIVKRQVKQRFNFFALPIMTWFDGGAGGCLGNSAGIDGHRDSPLNMRTRELNHMLRHKPTT